jgi:hypothetical protein
MYSARYGGAIWDMIFSTSSSEFEERLPLFEKIVGTVNVPFTPENTARQGSPISVGIGVGLILITLLLKAWQKRHKGKKVETT